MSAESGSRHESEASNVGTSARGQARYRALFESLPLGVVRQDAEGRIVEANPMACTLLGLTPDELFGRTSHDPRWRAVHEDGREFPGEAHPAMVSLATGAAVQGVVMGLDVPGASARRWICIESVPDRDDDGEVVGVFTMFRDITDQRRTEEESQRLERELQEALRLEAIGQIAGGVAHDLNNLLSPILGYAEMLCEELPVRSDLNECARAIEQSSLRARDLVQQLLAVARRQPLRFEAVDLAALVRSLQTRLRTALPPRTELSIVTEEPLPAVSADLQQLQQVVLAVVDHCVACSPDGELLVVRVRPVDIGFGHPQLCEGRHVGLTVEQRGPGLDAAAIAQSFEPFFKTRRRRNGLGLAAVYGVVRQHGGVVDVSNLAGEGVEYRILLPAAGVRRDDEGLPVPEPARGEPILLVEDDEEVRRLAAQVLRRIGYEVVVARSGEEALQVVRGLDVQPRLLITDVMMPGMDGRALYEAARQDNPRLEVIYMSGYAADVLLGCGISMRGVTFMHKPFTLHSLASNVRRILHARTDVSSSA